MRKYVENASRKPCLLEARKTTLYAVARFSFLAPVYEVWASFVEATPRRRVLELAAPKGDESILEVATGTGVQLVALAERNRSGRTVGIELASGMFKQTRARLRAANLDHVELHQGDARHLPFEDAVFDLVTSEYMLNLMPHADIVCAVSEFHRVLKPGGRLIVTNMTQGAERHHRIWDALYARGIDIYVNCRGVLAAPVLEQAGFTDIRREYMVPWLFPTEIVSARR
jgi:ubiquinone/menaquinone biosynthesis C-methylase UbiE